MMMVSPLNVENKQLTTRFGKPRGPVLQCPLVFRIGRWYHRIEM